MHKAERILQQLSLGFCRLKGIGVAPDTKIEDIRIQFDEWDWEVGVGLYGFWRYADDFNKDNLKQALIAWYTQKIKDGLPPIQINSTAPMLALTLLYKDNPNPEWEQLITRWADHLVHDAPKTAEGGLQHTVKERLNEGQLWDDTLFMAGLFLWVAGHVFDKQQWKDEALYQFLVHTRFLSDKKTGLWYHGWTFEGKHNYANAFWGRGNAWIAMAIPELLRFEPESNRQNPTLRALIEAWKSLMQSVMQLQHPDGNWTTLLTDPSSPKETSATAGFAYGLLLGQSLQLWDNVASESCIGKAITCIQQQINQDGLLQHASDGTAMGHDLQFYHDIGDAYTPYAQAIAMLLFCEQLKQQQG